MDVAAEELGHMEMVAETVNLLNGHHLNTEHATVGNIEAHVLTGLTPMLANASGQLWTAAYVNETGDILSDIAAEQCAKVVYQYLYKQINDKGVRETIDFLLNGEEAHNTMFREVFNRIQTQDLKMTGELYWIPGYTSTFRDQKVRISIPQNLSHRALIYSNFDIKRDDLPFHIVEILRSYT